MDVCHQWRMEFPIFSREIQGRSPKGHNCELWTTIFIYKHLWMPRVGVIYYGKCNYYALINCIRHNRLKGDFIHITIKFVKIFTFLLIWGNNLGSHTGWLVANPLWIRPWSFWFIWEYCSFLKQLTLSLPFNEKEEHLHIKNFS